MIVSIYPSFLVYDILSTFVFVMKKKWHICMLFIMFRDSWLLTYRALFRWKERSSTKRTR